MQFVQADERAKFILDSRGRDSNFDGTAQHPNGILIPLSFRKSEESNAN